MALPGHLALERCLHRALPTSSMDTGVPLYPALIAIAAGVVRHRGGWTFSPRARMATSRSSQSHCPCSTSTRSRRGLRSVGATASEEWPYLRGTLASACSYWPNVWVRHAQVPRDPACRVTAAVYLAAALSCRMSPQPGLAIPAWFGAGSSASGCYLAVPWNCLPCNGLTLLAILSLLPPAGSTAVESPLGGSSLFVAGGCTAHHALTGGPGDARTPGDRRETGPDQLGAVRQWTARSAGPDCGRRNGAPSHPPQASFQRCPSSLSWRRPSGARTLWEYDPSCWCAGARP